MPSLSFLLPLATSLLSQLEIRLISMLSFIHTTVWRTLFGKAADSLEKGTDAEDEYMISDANLLVNKYVSVPKDMGHLNCGAYVAGIVKVIQIDYTS